MNPLNRRQFLQTTAAVTAGATALTASPRRAAADEHGAKRIYLSVKWGMIGEGGSVLEKFKLMKELGYDGIELDSPGGPDKQQCLEASRETGMPVHGSVCSTHWGVRLSDPNPEVREKGLQNLLTALRETHHAGGFSVLLVPGRVSHPENENQQQVWDRSIEQIRKALPTAAKLGVSILIENVWNGFCYTHDGPGDQSADKLAEYLDTIGSPWVGSYFDIGNHVKYGKPHEWIRTLGRRIVKLDVKDWGHNNGFCKIGEGGVDWPAVRKALHDIGFTGWATAEVGGGKRDVLADVKARMDKYLMGVGEA